MKHLLLLLTILVLLSVVQAQKDSTQFVTTWRTTNSGMGGDSTVMIPIDTNYTYNYDIDWDNDGIFDDLGITKSIAHQYPDTGTYTIRIKGTYPRYYSLYFTPFQTIVGDDKLIALEQWGTNPWLNVEGMFWDLDHFTYNAVDTPNLTFITSLDELFQNNYLFNGNVSNWDVSRIKSMNLTFLNCLNFNQPMASWDVSSVIEMRNLFTGCLNFNQPLNNWNVDSVQIFGGMFLFTSFNQPLNNWNTGSAIYLDRMFKACPFNQPIDNWDVSRVRSMKETFANSLFNQPLNSWQVDSVQDMQGMFGNLPFYPANYNFNQPLNNWNTSQVRTMFRMFYKNKSFNQDVGNFDLSSINTTFFNVMDGMLDSTNLSVTNYDSTLIKWERQNPPCCIILGAAGLTYCAADSTRIRMSRSTGPFPRPRWVFVGDTLDCLGVGIEEELAAVEENRFKIYPNPSKGLFTIELATENNESREVLIYNIQGKLILQQRMLQERLQLNSEVWPVGVYFVRLGSETQKLVVK
jgi:hypothetical protein